jgi:hypothetical protein
MGHTRLDYEANLVYIMGYPYVSVGRRVYSLNPVQVEQASEAMKRNTPTERPFLGSVCESNWHPVKENDNGQLPSNNT